MPSLSVSIASLKSTSPVVGSSSLSVSTAPLSNSLFTSNPSVASLPSKVSNKPSPSVSVVVPSLVKPASIVSLIPSSSASVSK